MMKMKDKKDKTYVYIGIALLVGLIIGVLGTNLLRDDIVGAKVNKDVPVVPNYGSNTYSFLKLDTMAIKGHKLYIESIWVSENLATSAVTFKIDGEEYFMTEGSTSTLDPSGLRVTINQISGGTSQVEPAFVVMGIK